jgi:nitrite transporter NirC
MPIPIPQALAESGDLAVTKAGQCRRSPLRYLLSSALAGLFVGIAVVVLLSTAGPLVAAASPFAKLVSGAVFGIALTLVVFAGAELFTGNVMVMAQGLAARRVSGRDAASVLVVSLVGNLIGSVAFAAMVHAGGSLSGGPGAALAKSLTTAKTAATGPQLFWRAVLCNMLVCLALWMAARTKSDTAKLVVLWWALLAFIASGFEHSIANMTLFALATLQGTASWADLARNLLWTVPGNVVGGGLLVGMAYVWVLRPEPATPSIDVAAPPAIVEAIELVPV